MSDNTMAKPNKDKQCNTKHIEERQTNTMGKTNKDKQCLYDTHRRDNTIVRQYNSQNQHRQYHGQNQQGHKQCYTKHIEEQTIPWPKPTRKTMLYKTHRTTLDNTIAKTNKYKQCYMKHIEERQTIPCNTKYIEKRQTIS